MTRSASILIVILVLVVDGCAPTPAVKIPRASISPQAVQRITKANQELLQSLSGTGTISVESPDIAQSGAFELQLHKPDSVLVRVEGPFGIDVGSVLLTRENFTFYNSLRNQVVTGTVSPNNLRRIFRIDVTFDEIMALFTGGSFAADDDGTPELVTEEENQAVFIYRAEYGRRRYFVDPASMLITRVQHLDGNGKLFLEERFDRFRTSGDVSLPRYIRLTQHTARRAISVSFSTLDVNPARSPLMLDIPSNAERVRWKE